jgi:hypothetical protein
MNQLKLIAASWGRSFGAAAIAVYMAGVTDPKALATAGIAAIAGPLLKALDPKAAEFGRGSK